MKVKTYYIHIDILELKNYMSVFQWNMKYNHYSTGQIKFNYTLYKWSISNIYQGKYFENNTVKMSDNLKKVFK